MELLTEHHAAAHMTQAMNDIMAVGLSSKSTSLSPKSDHLMCPKMESSD